MRSFLVTPFLEISQGRKRRSLLKHELSCILVVFCDDHLYFVMMTRVRVWIKVSSVSKSMKTSSLMLRSWEQK